MGRPELGAKCTCVGCGLRFYDLGRSPAMCPKCATQQPPAKPRVLRSSRGPVENTPLRRLRTRLSSGSLILLSPMTIRNR